MPTKFNAITGLFDLVTDIGDNLEDIQDIVGTKGDLIAFDGSNWVGLGIGSNDQVLTADSSQSTGLKWADGGIASPVTVPDGGTGATSFTAGTYIIGNGTDALIGLDGTAKGSIPAGDGTTTPSILTVGSNGQVLSADDTEVTGLKWTTIAGTGDVTAAANLTDNSLIRGDGGAKGVQDSGILIDDTDNMSAVASINISAGGDLQINSTSVLNATTLGSGVTASSLTSVGTIATGTWEGTTIALDQGGTGSTAFTAGSVVFSNGSALTQDNSNLFWDDTNNRLGIGTATPLDSLHTSGNIYLVHTATENDDHALEIDCDAAGFGDVKAVDIVYTTGAVAAAENEEAMLINIDETASTGGEVAGLQVLTTTEGSAQVISMKCGPGVDAVRQEVGTFGDMDSALNKAVDVLAALSSGGAGNISVFVADNDTFTIGDAASFGSMEIIVDTGASGSGIAPTFEYSTGVGTWSIFSPADGTNGFRNTGVIEWDVADLSGFAVGTGSEYLIRITRTRNSLSTTPIIDKVQIAALTEYKWDLNGNINIKSVDIDASSAYSVAGTAILSDSAGTMTLSNVNALDATTESTIEAAIDTLANLTSASSLATVGTITSGTWSATDIAVDAGGSGRGTATAYAVICGGTTATGAHQSIAGLGSSGQVLTSNGAGALPTFQDVGGGDVSKVGTPVNNQIGVWTGDGTIEGDTALTFDTTTDTLAIGASGNLNFGAVTILADSAGTTTLQNIDALDATTETTIEAAIDTLANLTSATSLASVGTVTTGTWSATDIAVDAGGSGRGTATAYAVICGGTTATGAHQSIASVGTSGQVLTSNGAGALPTFQAASGGSTPDFVVQWSASALDVNYTPFAPIEQITTTNIIQKVRSFDYATIEYCDGHFEVPPDMDTTGTITFSVQWFARTVPSPSENVIWQIEHAAVATTEDLDSATFTAEVAAASATGTTQNALVRATWTETRANLGWVAGDTVYVKWSRKSTDANDTFDSAGTTADDALLVNATIIIPQA